MALPGGGDEFDSVTLGLQWQWNHNPDDSRWSLCDRPGWLRLRSALAPSLTRARNTITQKIVGPGAEATTQIDFSAMTEGGIAGICIQNIPSAFLGVEIRAGEPFLVMDRNGEECAAEKLVNSKSTIQLRVTATENGEAHFFWSIDGIEFHKIGEPFVMEFTVKTFLGNKFGLFCFNRLNLSGGHTDFDWFHLPSAKPSNHFVANEWIPACRYDSERGVDTQRIEAKRPRQALIRLSDDDWIQFNHIDFGVGGTRFEARVRGGGSGGEIHLHLIDAGQKKDRSAADSRN